MGPFKRLSRIRLCTSSALRQEARVHRDECFALVCYDRYLPVPTSCLEMAGRTPSGLYKRVANRSPDTGAGLLVLINTYYGATLILDRASQRTIIWRNAGWASGGFLLVEGWEGTEQW
ncbi:hypothetical protein F5J12DRAFT_787283 [Pisolithus orientalis]|uniref:uncharacterized protein n=1 Tax=Pisolithus orientalis TaxID=936130 RepID=UPI002224F054|nr:uncharacterized protein F5J12DRAFT_787283 [Pisolithus orientalis]KAI5986091.1 hypothetical protein F5J12DRAFT_787283 [Pisolithus orientalis]